MFLHPEVISDKSTQQVGHLTNYRERERDGERKTGGTVGAREEMGAHVVAAVWRLVVLKASAYSCFSKSRTVFCV